MSFSETLSALVEDGAVLAGLAILFVVFFVFTQPQAAADVIKATFELVSNVFDTVIEFLNALFS